MIETWLGNMNKHGVKVNDDFDVKFLCEGLDIVFKMDHYLLLTKVLAGLYNVADVFRGKVRAELFGAFLMDKYFYHLFFYWEENTRNIFMQLMLFKLLSVKRCQVRYEIKKRRKDKDFADTSLQPLAQAAAPSSTASSAGTGANNGSSSNNNSSSSTGGSSSAAAAAPSQGGDLPSPGGTMPIAPPSNFSDPANIVLLKRYDAFIRKIDETKAAMEADAQDVWSGELPLTQSASPQPSLHQHQQQSKKSKRGTSQTPPPTSLSQQQQQQQQQLEQDNSMGSKRRRKEFVVEEAPSVPLVNMVPGYVDSKEEEKEAGVANGRESTEVAITEGEVKAKTAQEKQEDEDDEKEKAEQAKQKEVDKEKEKENEKHQQQQHHQQVEGNTATANSNESDSKKRKRDKKTEKAEKKMAKKERKAAAQSGRTAAEEAIERVPEIPQSLLKYMEIAYSDYKCHLEKYKAWESKSIEPPKIISFN